MKAVRARVRPRPRIEEIEPRILYSADVSPLPVAAPALKPKPLTPPGGGLEELLAAAEERDQELAAELAGEDAVESWSPEKLVQIAEYGERERLASSKDDRLRKRLGAVHFLLCAKPYSIANVLFVKSLVL